MTAPLTQTKDVEVVVDPFTASFGGSILVSVPWLTEQSMVLAVPPRTRDGYTLCMAGHGEMGTLQLRGDSLVTIRVSSQHSY
jgi:DnaJ-class molecular chaperone